MAERVLVTGVNGTVGRAAALALHAAGYEVYGWDVGGAAAQPFVVYSAVDICDSGAVTAGMTAVRPDHVVHLAALVHGKGRDLSPEAYGRINGEAACRVFDAAAREGAHTILFSSTIEVYGPQSVRAVSEDAPCRPASPYGASKRRAEEHLLAMAGGPRRAVMRLAPVYAPGFRLNVDKRFYLPGKRAAYCFRDGSYSFHFCALRNVTDFLVRFLSSDAPSGAYNVSDRDAVTAADFLRMERAHNPRVRVLRLPYWPAYAAIAAAEGGLRLVRRGEPFLSRYNFRKLFASTLYPSDKARTALGGMDATLQSALYEEEEA